MNKLLLTLSLANLFSFPTNLILRSENSSLTNKESINSRYFDFPKKYFDLNTPNYRNEEIERTIHLNDGTKMWLPDLSDKSKMREANLNSIHFYYINKWEEYKTKYYKGLEKRTSASSYNSLMNIINSNIENNHNSTKNRINDVFKNINKNDIFDIQISLRAKNAQVKDEHYLNQICNGFDRWSCDNYKAQRWVVDNYDRTLTSIYIKAKYKKTYFTMDGRSKYLLSWYKWRNYLQNKSFITIDSDTGGNLKTELVGNQMSDGFKTNKQFLEDKINEFNSKNRNDLTLQYEITSSNTISLYLKGDNFREKLADEIKIYFQTTDKFQTQELESRLNITLGKWVDFNTHTTRLVDDVLVKDDKVKIVNSGTTRNAGRWIAHAPLKVSFNALKDETEVLKINGQRVDVLNQRFETNLNDNRKNSSDNEREFNHGYQPKENEKKDEKNSHLKNEYNIEITKYKPKTGNKDIEYTWTKTLVIESRSSEMDFKWYAWDPKTYAHQRELIEEFQKDEKGETKRDKTGKPIKNPKYDPKIDPNTGTKKELIWFDFNTHNPWIINSIYGDEKKYYEITNLPPRTKTLFAPHNDENDLDRGVIMEAVVIGKGALRQISKNIKDYRVHKLNRNGQFIRINDTWINILDKNTTESSYFSTEGIWLFTNNANKSITNFKIVYITKEENPNGYFTDYVTESHKTIKPLWQTNQGRRFYNYLTTKSLKNEKIISLKYEEAMEYYKQYINDLYFKTDWENYVQINPKFKQIEKDKYTVEQFKNKYINKPNDFQNTYLDEFNNKKLVSVTKLEFNNDKTGIYVYLKLNSNEIKYHLLTDKYFIPVKFKDIKIESKSTINLNLNSNYIYSVAKKNTKENFVSNLDSTKLFNNNKDDLDKIWISTSFSSLTNTLKVNVNLKDKYKNSHFIQPTDTFVLQIDKFKNPSSTSHNSNNSSWIDNNSNGSSSNNGGSSGANGTNNSSSSDRSNNWSDNENLSDIFSNINIEDINLGGIKEVKKAKEFIINKIKQALPYLELNKDYRIRNLDIVVEKLKYPQTNISKDNPIRSQTLILEAIAPKFGLKYILVANTINKELEKDFDLSFKKLNDFSVNENKLSELRKKIIENINDQFLNDGLVINLDLQITNLNNGLAYLSQGKGSEFIFTITGLNNYRIKNSTTVKVKNDASFVVDDETPTYKPGDEKNPDKAILYDLSYVNLSLKFSDHIMSSLRDKIINSIINELESRYFIKYKKHYLIDIDELNMLVKKISKKNDQANAGQLLLKPVNRVSQNQALIKVENFNKYFEPINDLNKPIKIDQANQATKQKKLLLIFIPLGLFSLTSVGLLGWFVYVRKIKSKIL
ncbi:hypothetical protein MZO39_01410 [Mycoplasma capricolum subsp. capricolum]|uniref:Mbov_0399 family ICE element protein n=1 Tax=Mycoplasma capricolum TaxID=2095 RepID=UPI0020BFD3CD|nr:hypothetical protein [Mycoplasma capricolum]MCK8461678.1 hypothetical protein [Mycoplasma capricolum subsp. capricolum]